VWLPVQAGRCFFLFFLENPLVPVTTGPPLVPVPSPGTKEGVFCLSSSAPVGHERPIPSSNPDWRPSPYQCIRYQTLFASYLFVFLWLCTIPPFFKELFVFYFQQVSLKFISITTP
jgi:hypothetical protein